MPLSALSWEAVLARDAPVVAVALRLCPGGLRRWGACCGAAFSAVVLAEVLAELAFTAVVVGPPRAAV